MTDTELFDPSRLGLLPWLEPAFAKLQQAVAANTLAHAYLLGGAPGIGKRSFARAMVESQLAKNSAASGNRAGHAEASALLASGSHPDLLWVAAEQDGRDIKIDQVRQLADFMVRSAHSGGPKFAVIEGADRLNGAAANALLKTLEEPNPNSHLLLISDLPGSLLATLRSRCQRLNLAEPAAAIGRSYLARLAAEQRLPDKLQEPLASYLSGNGDETEAMFRRPLLLLAQLAGLQPSTEGNQALGRSLLRLWEAGPHGAAGLLRAELSLLGKSGPGSELAWIGYLQSTSTIVIKYGLTGRIPIEADSEQQALCEMSPRQADSSLDFTRRLLRFQQGLQAARREQLGAGNPNPQLLQETLLWHWSQLQSIS